MGKLRQIRFLDFVHRGGAAGCALLVFALGLFAASPRLHKQLHHDPDSPAGDECAIVLFADGVALPLAVNVPPPPVIDRHEPAYARSTEIVFDSPRYLLQPGRGPPVG